MAKGPCEGRLRKAGPLAARQAGREHTVLGRGESHEKSITEKIILAMDKTGTIFPETNVGPGGIIYVLVYCCLAL